MRRADEEDMPAPDEAERREFAQYRTRVVAFTVGLVLVVAGGFVALQWAVGKRLTRTSVDGPWHELVRTLERDPFVRAALLADPGGADRPRPTLAARDLDPDPRVVAWIVLDAERLAAEPGAPGAAVLDRYVRDPESEPLADRLLARLRGIESRPGPASRTRLEGGLAVRVDALRATRPEPPAPLRSVNAAALRRVRPALDAIDARVLPGLERAVTADGAAATGRRLEAWLDLYGSLSLLLDDVLVPWSLSVGGAGSEPDALPSVLGEIVAALEGLERVGGDEVAAVPDAPADTIAAWARALDEWYVATEFVPARSAWLGAVFSSPQLALLERLARLSLFMSAVLALVGGVVGVVLARRTTEPLARILDGIGRFAHGELGHRIEIGRGGELEALARDLNEMADQIDRGERARRLASMGLVVGGAAHELKNPVHALKGALGLVDGYARELFASDPGGAALAPERRRELEARVVRLLSGGLENVAQMAQILEEIQVVTRLGSDPTERQVLADVARAAVQAERARWEGEIDVEVVAEGATELEAAASIGRIPANLVSNALSAVEEARAAGRPAGRVRVRLAGTASAIRLAVDDDGDGVPEDVRERIFDLFYTTREVGRGTGLGLYLVHEIARAHGGTVRCESPGALGGATFTVELPRVRPAAATPDVPLRGDAS